LTKSIDLEKADKGLHRYFRRGEPLPFESKEILGSGGSGQVDRVLSLISSKEYARKQVPRRVAFGGGEREETKRFISEIEILKRLRHDHVVEFVGSYTDPKYLGLIMSPVADMDLSAYLKNAKPTDHREMRTFFGCLATALQFLHGQNVRHKDIKPGNILVHGRNVLLTDFGLSRDFTDASGSTTMGTVNGRTLRYCAPEVALHEARNSSSDIWSLGVVFLEMMVVLKGMTIEIMKSFFEENGSKAPFVRTNPSAFAKLVTELKEEGLASDNMALSWIMDMVQVDHSLRPSATSLVTSIEAACINTALDADPVFCGVCCLSTWSDVSDGLDELEDDAF
jgi:serine/threonine protein kinase